MTTKGKRGVYLKVYLVKISKNDLTLVERKKFTILTCHHRSLNLRDLSSKKIIISRLRVE